MNKIRLYLNDWFINIGIIGFIRIVENANKKDELCIENNYVEFDSSLLKDFHTDYFNYFLKKYDITKRECEKVDKYLFNAKKEEKFKDSVKYIKTIVDNNRNKISGKFKESLYENEFNDISIEVGNIKDFNELTKLEEKVNRFKKVISIKEVNDKLTVNYFRNIVYKGYFGQVSFLQKTCAAKTVNEQAEIMSKGYLKPILEEIEFDDVIENCNNLENLKTYIEHKLNDANITKGYITFLNRINKLTKKRKLEEIKLYLKNEILHCSIWEDYRATCDYTEGLFVPLAVSMGNSQNFMWKFDTSYPISNLVKLILFCTPAGVVPINDGYFGFVNMDTSLEELYSNNESFNLMEDKKCAFENLIYGIVDTNVKKSAWILENILFIEFNANIDAKSCKLNYFNIPKSTAIYFKNHAKNDISKMIDNQFKNNLVSLILNNKILKTITYKDNYNSKDISIITDINSLIDTKLRNDIRINSKFSYDAVMATIVNYKLNKIKSGSEEMDNKKIWVVFKNGQKLNKYYTDKGSANKIQGIAYRLLNSSKAGNKKLFMDSMLRIYMTAGIEIPTILLNVLHENDMDFETVAHAFISGFISSEKQNENVKIGEGN